MSPAVDIPATLRPLLIAEARYHLAYPELDDTQSEGQRAGVILGLVEDLEAIRGPGPAPTEIVLRVAHNTIGSRRSDIEGGREMATSELRKVADDLDALYALMHLAEEVIA